MSRGRSKTLGDEEWVLVELLLQSLLEGLLLQALGADVPVALLLQALDGCLEQLILPLGVQSLPLKELLIAFECLCLLLPLTHLLLEFTHLLLHLGLVVILHVKMGRVKSLSSRPYTVHPISVVHWGQTIVWER